LVIALHLPVGAGGLRQGDPDGCETTAVNVVVASKMTRNAKIWLVRNARKYSVCC
jgi:hypothetical protein